MIILFRLRHDGEDHCVVCPRASVTVAELRMRMLQRAKVVEGSYAARLIDDLHAAIFLQALDLKADYTAYFACEYPSFDEYLRRRTKLPAGIVSKLAVVFDVSSGVYYFKPVHSFLSGQYGLDFLTQLLEDPPTQEVPS